MNEEHQQLSFDFQELKAEERLLLNAQCKYVEEQVGNVYDLNFHRRIKLSQELAFYYSEILKLVVHLQK